MGMTLNDFEAKALQVLLSQRFLSLPLFEEEELSEYHIADNQGEMNLEDFIRQYAEVITEQYKFDYENRLKADLKAILVELQLEIEEKEQYYQDKFLDSKNAVHDAAMGGRMFGCGECKELIQQKINALKENDDGDK